MNMHPVFAAEKLKSPALTKLKAWRKKQMVKDPETGVTRTMRITDVPRLYGIAVTTWHQWEQPVGHKDFKRPNGENMARLCGEITQGAVRLADFYPPMGRSIDEQAAKEG